VDYPATQLSKQERLRELGLDVPSHLTFRAIDFEAQSILEVLRMNGFRRRNLPFLIGGVVQYLTEEALVRTLTEVARAGPWKPYVLLIIFAKKMLRRGGSG